MYYLPEIYQNGNHIDFGKVNDQPIEDVCLPPWAENDPSLFVHIMRDALESDYVSSHLNEWIDLIFGYKQRGEEAIHANNVFYPTTYEVFTYHSIHIQALDDEVLGSTEDQGAIAQQVHHYGHVPNQLFLIPHPSRNSGNGEDETPSKHKMNKPFTHKITYHLPV